VPHLGEPVEGGGDVDGVEIIAGPLDDFQDAFNPIGFHNLGGTQRRGQLRMSAPQRSVVRQEAGGGVRQIEPAGACQIEQVLSAAFAAVGCRHDWLAAHWMFSHARRRGLQLVRA
jgi:hypothetical protein